MDMYDNWQALFTNVHDPQRQADQITQLPAMYVSREPVPGTWDPTTKKLNSDMITRLIDTYKKDLKESVAAIPNTNSERLQFLQRSAIDNAYKFLLNEQPTTILSAFDQLNAKLRRPEMLRMFDISEGGIRGCLSREMETAAEGACDLYQAARKQISWAYNEYISSGEQLMRYHADLLADADKMDKIADKINSILSLGPNSASDTLIESFSVYISQMHADLNIEKKWRDFTELMARREYIRQLLDIPLATSRHYEAPLCPVCINNSVSHVITPCGHTFCETCIGQTRTCMVCRGVVNRKLKLFFG